MTAGTYDILIEQGATFRFPLVWKDPLGALYDLTGYTARMQVRKTAATADPPMLTLTTENGGIVLGGAAGTITITASATATAALTGQQAVYDIELINPSGEVDRLLMGAVEISPEVTR